MTTHKIKPGPALFALALGGLCIGTTEFAAMGLLPDIARDLGTTIPETGNSITSYALGVVIGAPVLTVLAARIDRKILLMLLMTTYTLANIFSAFAPNLGLLVAGRFLAGLPHGAFFGVGAVIGTAVVGPEKRGHAVSIMMSGLTIANIVGVPLTTMLGQNLGWRISYIGIGILGLLTLVGLWLWTPRLPTHAEATIRTEMAALRNRRLWTAFAATSIGFGGMFAVYSYVAPLLTEETGLESAMVPLVLAICGVGMTAGAIVAGKMADRSVMRTVFTGFFSTAAILVLMGITASPPWLAVVGVTGLGFVGSLLAISLQARLMDLSPHAPSLGASLSHAGLNIGNALGAWAGGMALTAGWGYLAPAWVGLGLTLTGLAIFAIFGRGAVPHRIATQAE